MREFLSNFLHIFGNILVKHSKKQENCSQISCTCYNFCLQFLKSPWRPFWTRVFLVSLLVYTQSIKHKLSFSHHAAQHIVRISHCKVLVQFLSNSSELGVFISGTTNLGGTRIFGLPGQESLPHLFGQLATLVFTESTKEILKEKKTFPFVSL